MNTRTGRSQGQCAHATGGAPTDGIIIGRATAADYAPLAAFHYRAGPPATCSRVLVARDARARPVRGSTPPVVAVLVVSRPVLNGPWRDRLWPGVFTQSEPRARAAALNRGLRCISRVIVEPRYRALGLARRLVEAYLIRPMTARTEAVAAMGALCPFFARAGMRAVPVPRSARDRRLARAVRRAGLRPWRLMEVGAARAALQSAPCLIPALRTWARASRQTRPWAEVPAPDLWPLVVRGASSLCARPVAYGHRAS